MKASPFWSLWGWPLVMGVLTTTGLTTALVSDTWGFLLQVLPKHCILRGLS